MAYTFQKVYTLIAQTPMIHFQHDQSGATLRATEVKPKLDRYLLECAINEGITKEIRDSWHVGYDPKDAKRHEKSYKGLNYRMKIEKMGHPVDSKITLDDCKFYFANQGDGEKKEIVFNNCKMQIDCFLPVLLEFIDKHIGDFFVLHNFGSRQTKGFGGFLISGQTSSSIEAAFQKTNQLYFYADMPMSDRESIKNRFNHALTVYSVMKNGLNMTRYNEERRSYRFRDRYIKGFAMRGYLDKLPERVKIGSDKAFIKSKVHIAVNGDEKDALDLEYKNYTFIRALLGLAEQYEFRDRYRNNGTSENPRTHRISYNPVGVTIINCPRNEDGTPKIVWDCSETDMKKIVSGLKKTMDIQRFASPVTIKIYQDRIYFLFDDSYKKMLDQTFLFLAFKKIGRNYIYESIQECLEKKHYLSAPKTFDMKAFIDYFVTYYNGTVKNKLRFFIEPNPNIENPYANSLNLTLQKGW